MTITDERLAEIINPPDIIGETELVSLAREVRELRAECERLRKHLKGANSGFEEYERRYYLEVNNVEQLTRERDAAREFNRRFRFSGKSNGVDEYEFWAIARDYDVTQNQQPQPAKVEWVPWTSETRPRGTIWIRIRGDGRYEWAVVEWGPDGFIDSAGDWYDWGEACKDLEWSRDGVTWNRCGTEVVR